MAGCDKPEDCPAIVRLEERGEVKEEELAHVLAHMEENTRTQSELNTSVALSSQAVDTLVVSIKTSEDRNYNEHDDMFTRLRGTESDVKVVKAIAGKLSWMDLGKIVFAVAAIKMLIEFVERAVQ
ncbi:hypothetical protein LCGC14_1169950 [marine sediment metagenome]|uniref:Uncharacterized protein n=1 Tax=marine sediment metagenome TaxID=412755 RepID=A0A0F9MD29_9ZZZZ